MDGGRERSVWIICFALIQTLNWLPYGDTKGQIGALERPKARDINCRPVVKYAYDQYTGEYTKELRVKNVSESTFDESFISGFSGSDGQTIWNQCRDFTILLDLLMIIMKAILSFQLYTDMKMRFGIYKKELN